MEILGNTLDDEIMRRVEKALKENKFPEFDNIYSDTFSELLDKLIITHIRYWYLEDAMASAETDEELANLRRKSEVLFEFLSGSEYQKVIVFGQTKNGVEDLAVHLSKKGLLVESIHGDKRQNQRKASLMRFKANEIKILIATDVVSRGIDISDVSHVINYDLPRSQDEYIHRIGRTGRAGKKGLALTLID
jgi:superfamily II DNA/RNA helicase